MKSLIIAAATAIVGLIALTPAMAKEASPSRPSEFERGTSGNFPWNWDTAAPSFGSVPCSEILASPKVHPKSQVEYCRSAEHG